MKTCIINCIVVTVLSIFVGVTFADDKSPEVSDSTYKDIVGTKVAYSYVKNNIESCDKFLSKSSKAYADQVITHSEFTTFSSYMTRCKTELDNVSGRIKK